MQLNFHGMIIVNYILFNLLFINLLNDIPKDKTLFRPPVRIPVLLSANFGELRPDHFHSGIDIKTQGVIGHDVVSSADGYVYRISVSPSGFGKTLYIRHPSGYSTVYAHLDRFTPDIEDYVKAIQYERKSFLVNIFPPKDRFPVLQGDLIAYSGNSGSSGGPHLHFEVREAEKEFPVNPLLFDFDTNDNIAPVIERMAIYPAGRNSFVNNSRSDLKMGVKGGNGRYYAASDREITVSGRIGFGFRMHDLLNGSHNKCAVYSIELQVDSLPVYKYVIDGFSFTETRYINSHIDYPTYVRENVRFQKTFVLPNDKFSGYKSVLNRGVYSFNDDKVHNIRLIVTDASNNKSVLTFNVRSTTGKPAAASGSPEEGVTVMPFSKVGRFTAENISVSIPSGALYDTLHFTYKSRPGTSQMYSDIHSVHDRYTPLMKAYSLSIKPARIPAGRESKMLIVQMNGNNRSPVNAQWSEGFLKTDIISFGDFYVGIDTVAPVIIPTVGNGADLTGRKELRFRIRDDFSGIKSYEPFIDDKWALFEYDPKNELLIYRFDEKYITRNRQHSLTLRVTDNRDNEKIYSCEFRW